MDVEAFRCFQLDQGLTLDLEHLNCATLPLVRSRDRVCGGARPAGLREAGRPRILLNFLTPVPEIKTHPKLVELIRIKQNMNGTKCKAHVISEKLTAQNVNLWPSTKTTMISVRLRILFMML